MGRKFPLKDSLGLPVILITAEGGCRYPAAHLARYVPLARIMSFRETTTITITPLMGTTAGRIYADAGVKFAQMGEVMVAEKRFLCATLWTDFALHGDAELGMKIAVGRMNDDRDIRYIRPRYRLIWLPFLQSNSNGWKAL